MVTMKTRSASKAAKGTPRLSPNGDEKSKAREAAEAAINGMVLKVNAERLPPLEQKFESGELTLEEFQKDVGEIQFTIIKMAAEVQLVIDKVDENSKMQAKI